MANINEEKYENDCEFDEGFEWDAQKRKIVTKNTIQDQKRKSRKTKHTYTEPSTISMPRATPPQSKTHVGSKNKRHKLRTSSDVYKRLLWDQTLGFKQEAVVIGYINSISNEIEEVSLLQWTPIDKGGDIPMHHITYFALYINDKHKFILWDKRTRLDRLFGSGNTCKKDTFRHVLPSIMEAQATKNNAYHQEKHNQTFLQKLKTEYNPHCDQNVCLWMNGSFFPIHKNHVFILNTARSYFLRNTEIQYNVMCCIITVTHSNGLIKKFGGNKRLERTAIHRVKMCEVATQDMDWIVIDPWLSSQPRNVGAAASKKHLKNLLDLKYGEGKIKLIPVIGDDNIFKMKNAIKYGPVLCVLNREKRKDIETFLQMKEIETFKTNLMVCHADMNQIPSSNCSSTKIRSLFREGIHLKDNEKYLHHTIHVNVLKYHQRHHITYREFKEQPQSTARKNKGTTLARSRLLDLRQNNIRLFKELGVKPVVNMDEFQMDSQLRCGKGVQGEVNEVYWITKKAQFALKTYKMTKRYGKQLKGYRNELSCLMSLNDHKHGGHNNIIKLFGAGYNAVSCFVILELFTINLQDFMIKNFVTWWDGNDVIDVPNYWLMAWSKLANACGYMNEMEIMHRDLTVSNIMVRLDKNNNEQFDLVLIDFGTANRTENANQNSRGSTRHYAPESLGVEYIYNTKSEVFSFGNGLFEFLHKGKVIYHDTKRTCDVWKSILTQQTPTFEKQCNLDLKILIESCWQFDAAQRPTFYEIEQTLIKMIKQ